MTRSPLILALALALTVPASFGSSLGCAAAKKQPKQLETEPINTGDPAPEPKPPKSESQLDSDKPEPPKKDECSGFEIADLMDALQKSSCEIANPKPEDKPLEKEKLEVKVSASALKVAAGGHIDILVTFTNKSKDAIPLTFTIDPLPRFDIEAYDAKNHRVDMPPKGPPPLPSGVPARVPGDPKSARVMLAANGTARVRLGWDAVKTKWAPEKLKGTPPEKGYPRTPNGPLAKGKYVLRVVMPLVGVFEGMEKEVSAPKLPIEVSTK